MYTLTIEDNPVSEDVKALAQGLTAHALPYVQVPGFQSIGALMRDEHGVLVGGVWGYINWNWLAVGLVWVADDLRGRGYGRRLIGALETAARERGCRDAHLDTFSYQARPFYEKLGYEVFATLDDYPPGHQRYFMKKALNDSSVPAPAPPAEDKSNKQPCRGKAFLSQESKYENHLLNKKNRPQIYDHHHGLRAGAVADDRPRRDANQPGPGT